MPKYVAVALCCAALALAAQGCTERHDETNPDAFVPFADDSSAIDSARSDAGGDAGMDGAARDTGGSACGAQDLHSQVGASVATGTTTGGTDHFTPECGDPGAPDAVFSWTAPTAGSWAADTLGSDYDTVVDVLSGCTGTSLGCDDDAHDDGTSSATFTATAGQTVIIVVDGFSGDTGNYVLGIHESTPEICDDHIDNDGDGEIDCADYHDCDGQPGCVETNCTDGIDNDADGETDCLDYDCDGMTGCVELICDDGVDNDGDGETDCHDYDCSDAANCTETNCTDGVDNDLDGEVDCEDYDCAADPTCDEASHCLDNIDNDADGATDCADDDCAADATCAVHEMNCENGTDDDHDGAIDCSDPDCDADCGENTLALCMNAMDDDSDGLTDCSDLQCSCSTACPPVTAPSMTCPDLDIGSVLGRGVFHGVTTPYACGAREDASCAFNGALGSELEIQWKAPADGTYVFDTNDTSHAGGTFDTVVTVRTGCDAASDELACDDDGGTGRLSEVFVDLVHDQTVIIVLDGLNVWDGGNVTLNIRQD